MLDSEEIGEEEGEIVSECNGKTAMFTVEMCALLSGFTRAHPNFAPLSPNITWARGSDSLRITEYKKG